LSKIASHRRAAEDAEDVFFVWRRDIAKQKLALAEKSAFFEPFAFGKYLGSVPVGMGF